MEDGVEAARTGWLLIREKRKGKDRGLFADSGRNSIVAHVGP